MWQTYYDAGYKQALDAFAKPAPLPKPGAAPKAPAVPTPPKQLSPVVKTPGIDLAKNTAAAALEAPSPVAALSGQSSGTHAATSQAKHSGILRRPLTNEDGYDMDRTVSNGFKMVDQGPRNSDSVNAENKAVG